MKILLLTLFLSGCATGDWANYNYGPGDWLNENTSLNIVTMYNYEHFVEPTIEVHYVESVEAHCGTMWAQGCANLVNNHCDIYVSKVASPSTLAHEERHCRGWDHYRPRFEMFSMMGEEFRNKEIARASGWFPLGDADMAIAMAQVHNKH